MFANIFQLTPAQRRFGEERKKAQERDGLHFGPKELADLLTIWADLVKKAKPIHTAEGLQFGEGSKRVEITLSSIKASPGAQTPEFYSASMQHVAKHWGGRAQIVTNPNNPMSKAQRLEVLAYAKAYGIEMVDPYQQQPATRLTAADRAAIRQMAKRIEGAMSATTETAPRQPAARAMPWAPGGHQPAA